MDRDSVIAKALTFFSDRDYKPVIRTNDLLVFESGEKGYDLLILIVLFILGIAPAILYYAIAPRLQVRVSLSGKDDAIKVTASGNTDGATEDALEFLKALV